MSKFKISSLKSYRDYLQSLVSRGMASEDALRVVDYALAHPSSLEQAREQAARAERKREEIRKKRALKPTPETKELG